MYSGRDLATSNLAAAEQSSSFCEVHVGDVLWCCVKKHRETLPGYGCLRECIYKTVKLTLLRMSSFSARYDVPNGADPFFGDGLGHGIGLSSRLSCGIVDSAASVRVFFDPGSLFGSMIQHAMLFLQIVSDDLQQHGGSSARSCSLASTYGLFGFLYPGACA